MEKLLFVKVVEDQWLQINDNCKLKNELRQNIYCSILSHFTKDCHLYLVSGEILKIQLVEIFWDLMPILLLNVSMSWEGEL